MANIAEKLKKLPDQPGVYLFYNSKNEIIYVGKASSLRSRVRSYFVGKKTFRPIEEMFHEVVNVDWRETNSALEAALLEGECIKKYRPRYNILWRDDKSWNYLYLTKEKFSRLRSVREHDLVIKTRFFGPFPNLNTKEAIKILRRLFFVSNCDPGAKKPCFDYQIGRCLGVCTGEISVVDYNEKVIVPLKLFLRGHKKRLLTNLKKEMATASKKENFEEAGRLRNQIISLEKIQDAAMLNKSFVADVLPKTANMGIRIEGYDISNLGVTHKVGSMVVFDGDGPVKSAYRKFNIKTVIGQNDVDCLGEMLARRLNHDDWPMPDIFLVDGGLPQVNRAIKILKNKKIKISVVGIAKGPKRKKNEFYLAVNGGLVLGQRPMHWLKLNKMLLIRARDEAHRFALAFNRQKRRIL